LDQYSKNRFVRPARGDLDRLLSFDQRALGLLPPDYQPIELSPVAPLGSHSIPAAVDQNKVVATSRNTEVVADPCNVMALESAVRRRGLLRKDPKSADRVKLCSSHRVLRAQHFDAPDAFAHFRLLALTTAGRDTGSHEFEFETLHEQLDYYLRLLTTIAETRNDDVRLRILVTDLTDGKLTPFIQECVIDRTLADHSGAEIRFDPVRQSGRGYYKTLCFKIHCVGGGREPQEIGDGGFTDWTQKLLSDRKERFLIGCLAGERVVPD
jgi:hypothetical protein